MPGFRRAGIFASNDAFCSGSADRGGRDEAERRLRRALPILSAAAGGPVAGHVGDANPLAAIEDALHLRGFDEIILSTLPSRLSRWLRVDLPSKVRALGPPVLHVTDEELCVAAGFRWEPRQSPASIDGMHTSPSTVSTDLAPSAGEQWLSVAEEITARGLWCVIEEPRDGALEEWEPRLIICSKDIERIAASVVEFVKGRARIAGYTRDRLVRVNSAPTAICAA